MHSPAWGKTQFDVSLTKDTVIAAESAFFSSRTGPATDCSTASDGPAIDIFRRRAYNKGGLIRYREN